MIGLGLVWYFYQKFTPEQLNQMKNYVLQANYWWLGLSVFLTIISHVLRTHRWHLLLAPLDHFPNGTTAFCLRGLFHEFIYTKERRTLKGNHLGPLRKSADAARVRDHHFRAHYRSDFNAFTAIGLNYAILVDYLIAAILLSS